MMFNSYLQKSNKKAVEYFEHLIKCYETGKKNIPNSIILWGSDTIAQYFFAVEIARQLNCKKDKAIDCNCLSCNWIRKNEHPELKIISKINSKPDGDKTQVISDSQIKAFLEQISYKSEDYRVVIFCDADIEKISQEQKNYIENFEELKTAMANDEDKYWIPKPLNSKIFQEKSANALLKTVEETPQKLLFIFLTSSPNDLISTIVSRSQMFYIQNSYTTTYDYSFCQKIFNSFGKNMGKENFFEFTQASMDYIKEKEINLYSYLELIQAYFTKLLETNYNNIQIKEKILKTIEQIILAKKYDLASVKTEYILDNFWINIS